MPRDDATAAMRALDPVRLGPMALRNRFVKAATFEGMTPGGQLTDALVTHHANMARREVALTTVAYGAVAPAGRTFADQLLVEGCADLERLPRAVHEHGGAASLQLVHCGGFSKNRAAGRPAGPSFAMNAYGLAYGVPFVREMTPTDIERCVGGFARAGKLAREAGFDAVELHLGHGYLLSQFLSPLFNRRRDAWGGDLPRRLRFPVAVVEAVREAVGPDVAVLAKINTTDGVRGGANETDAEEIARTVVKAGVDALVPSAGLVQRSAFYLMRGDVPLLEMAQQESSWLQRASMRSFAPLLVRTYPYAPAFLFDGARRVLDAVDAPVGLLGGVDSGAAVGKAMEAGFDFVVMGRALLSDPDFIVRLRAGADVVSRCTHCNLCVALMNDGVRCHLPATTERGRLPQ